jgi:ribose transport system ATP-binding protein
MDEPTSSLTLAETERLLAIIGDLRANGVSVIYVTHRLSEIAACADRVVALRDGERVGELARHEISAEAMIRLMIGRDLQSLYTPQAQPSGEAVLEIDAVRTTAFPDCAVSIAVARGEILGLAGLIGSGRTELARAVFGVDPMLAGTVRLHGRELAIASPRDAIGQGLFLVPEDRKLCGLLLDLPIAQNISLPQLEAMAPNHLVPRAGEAAAAEAQRRQLGIRAPSVDTVVGSLSGGNQQKVVLAKWLAMAPKAIIFDEPTRGVDVGAKKEIYAIIRTLADAGIAILMISSDMEEVIGVSDRMVVMCEGRIGGMLERAEVSEHAVLQLAIGGARH